MNHLVFEAGLALTLIAIAAVVSSRLKFSIIPFLILVGMAVGPHAPTFGIIDLRFIHSAPLIDFMGRLGVLFLLFYLGLEFSIGRLIKAGRSIAVGGAIYIGINFSIGLLYPFLLGWPLAEILVMAGITTISSSAIVAKVIVDLRRSANQETEMILGIIMAEDIFLAVYLSVVSGLVLSQATSIGGIAISVGIAFVFMIGLLALGRWAVPLLNRWLTIRSGEVFLLVILAPLLFIAGLAEMIHVAEAIGALLVGLILAETEHRQRIEQLVIPFRDFFGALFFFGFGLTIDPRTLGDAVWITLGAVILTLIGNLVAGMLAGKSAQLSPRNSARIGLTIVSRGEFSIIVANLAESGGLMTALQPFAALYVLTLAIAGPILTKESDKIYALIRNVLPARKQSNVD